MSVTIRSPTFTDNDDVTENDEDVTDNNADVTDDPAEEAAIMQMRRLITLAKRIPNVMSAKF